jgi:hypothetical protein
VSSDGGTVLDLKVVDGVVQIGTREGLPEPLKDVKTRSVSLCFGSTIVHRYGIVLELGFSGVNLLGDSCSNCLSGYEIFAEGRVAVGWWVGAGRLKG